MIGFSKTIHNFVFFVNEPNALILLVGVFCVISRFQFCIVSRLAAQTVLVCVAKWQSSGTVVAAHSALNSRRLFAALCACEMFAALLARQLFSFASAPRFSSVCSAQRVRFVCSAQRFR